MFTLVCSSCKIRTADVANPALSGENTARALRADRLIRAFQLIFFVVFLETHRNLGARTATLRGVLRQYKMRGGKHRARVESRGFLSLLFFFYSLPKKGTVPYRVRQVHLIRASSPCTKCTSRTFQSQGNTGAHTWVTIFFFPLGPYSSWRLRPAMPPDNAS